VKILKLVHSGSEKTLLYRAPWNLPARAAIRKCPRKKGQKEKDKQTPKELRSGFHTKGVLTPESKTDCRTGGKEGEGGQIPTDIEVQNHSSNV